MRRLTLKEGPLVFLRNVLIMEILAAGAFFILSFLENYELLYMNLALSHLLRYDIFLMASFSFFQLVYLSVLFLEWYFSSVEVTAKEITRYSGLIFRRRKTIPLGTVVSVEVTDSPLERLMHHASIILQHEGNRETKIKNVNNPEEALHLLKQLLQEVRGLKPEINIKMLLTNGENSNLEFKQTLRFDVREKKVNKEMERAVLKTLVGFLNAEGGTLLIGVNDAGQPLGLKADLDSLAKPTLDGLENHILNLAKTAIGLPFAKYLDIRFEKIDGQDICLVIVNQSHKPAYLKLADKEEFFVRVGNATQPLSISEAQEYIKNKWK